MRAVFGAALKDRGKVFGVLAESALFLHCYMKSMWRSHRLRKSVLTSLAGEVRAGSDFEACATVFLKQAFFNEITT
jgi:hypothetical protein